MERGTRSLLFFVVISTSHQYLENAYKTPALPWAYDRKQEVFLLITRTHQTCNSRDILRKRRDRDSDRQSVKSVDMTLSFLVSISL